MATIKKNSTIKKLERTDAMDESRQNAKDILKKYKRENIIDNERDLKILERYAATGMVEFSIGQNKKTLAPAAKAKLTEMGRWFITQL